MKTEYQRFYEAQRLNAHQTHFEDLVVFGKDGLNELNDKIEKISKYANGSSAKELNVTVKIDGSPSLFCWHTYPGLPDNSVSLKGFIKSENPKCFSNEKQIMEEYGDRPDMAEEMIEALKIAPHIPENEAWQGDCLFVQNTLFHISKDEDCIAFQPNKIVYAVPFKSDLGKRIASSTFGIAFHTRYAKQGDDNTQYFDIDLNKLNIDEVHPELFIMNAEIPSFKSDTSLNDIMEQLQEHKDDLSTAEHELLGEYSKEYAALCDNEDFIRFYFQTYQNKVVADNKSVEIPESDFITNLAEYIDDKLTDDLNKKEYKTEKGKIKAQERTSAQIKELDDMITDNAEVFQWIVSAINSAAEIKMIFWDKLKNVKMPFDTLYKSRTHGFIPAENEGIAVSDMDGNIVKIVDRTTFSSNNRNPDIMAGWEHPEDKALHESMNDDTAVVAFGRMNPPHIGHVQLTKKLQQIGQEHGTIGMLYLSHSVDSKKNPLDYNTKLDYCRKAFDKYCTVVESDAKTALQVLHEIYADGWKNLVYVCGEDRLDDGMTDNIKKYNGVHAKSEAQDKSNFYQFDSISFENAGLRDDNSNDIIIQASASKMREAAKNDDYESFAAMSPFDNEDDTKAMYEDVKKGLSK
jgi:hypothetical protein